MTSRDVEHSKCLEDRNRGLKIRQFKSFYMKLYNNSDTIVLDFLLLSSSICLSTPCKQQEHSWRCNDKVVPDQGNPHAEVPTFAVSLKKKKQVAVLNI